MKDKLIYMPNATNLIYIAQEKAMAPGISGKWPKIIKHPNSKHGILVGINISHELMMAVEDSMLRKP